MRAMVCGAWLLVGAAVVSIGPAGDAHASSSPQPLGTIEVDLPANDLAFDATRGVLWASVGSSAGSPNGNAVVPIDPQTGAVGAPVFVGSEPGQLALSSDGQFLYVSLDGADAVRRVSLITRTADIQFAAGAGVTDLEVMPGDARTVAVAADQFTRLYTDGVARPTTVLHGPSQLVFSTTTPGRLYGYDGTSTTSRFFRMTVAASGVSVDDATSNLLRPGPGDILMSGSFLTDGSVVIDPEARTRVASGKSSYSRPGVVFDANAGRIYAVGIDTAGSGSPVYPTLEVMDMHTFGVIDAFRLIVNDPGAFALPTLLSTGGGRFAATPTGTEVVLFDVASARGAFGEYTPLTPARVLDTRAGLGAAGALGPGRSVSVQIAGRGGVPEGGVSAVVLNATAVDPTDATYVTIWPSGIDRPEISSLNIAAGMTRANLVTVMLGAGGALSIYNDTGSVHALFDVVGFYATSDGIAGSRYRPVNPQRAFDTRSGQGGVGAAPLGPSQTIGFDVLGKAGVPMTGVSAVVLNVTATDATADSYLTVWPADASRPEASAVNFRAGTTVPNLVIVRVPTSGIVNFFNYAGLAHVVADVFGYYTMEKVGEGGRFVPFYPVRLLDTRVTKQSTCCNVFIRGKEADLYRFDEPFAGYVLNIAVTEVRGSGYVTAFPYPGGRPVVSNVNFVDGESVANAAVVPTGPAMVLNKSAGSLAYVVDAFGAFTKEAS